MVIYWNDAKVFKSAENMTSNHILLVSFNLFIYLFIVFTDQK